MLINSFVIVVLAALSLATAAFFFYRELKLRAKINELVSELMAYAFTSPKKTGTVNQQPAEGTEHDSTEEEMVEEELPELLVRMEALGFECSDPLTSDDVCSIDDDALPMFGYDEEDRDVPANCGRCGASEIRIVTAGRSRRIKGHLGNYCFACGFGKYLNHEEVADAKTVGNLFLLLKEWEPEAPIESAPTAGDEGTPSASVAVQ